MSYPPQNPYNPGAAPTPGPGFPAEGQYSAPPNPTTPMPAADGGYGTQPGYGTPAGQPAPASYDQGFAAAGFGQPAPPFSGPPAPPFSGPPAPPFPGQPVGAYGAPAPKGKPTVLILAIVAGLLFVLGGVMTGLFISTGSELDDTRKDLTAQVVERDTTISTKESEISELQSDLERAKAELDSTKQTLTGTQNERDQVAKEKAAIGKCLTLVDDFIGALANGNTAKAKQLQPSVDKACTEADKYL